MGCSIVKTLIINGSPKIDGDTTSLINEFTDNLEGETKILSYIDDIEPCSDCRYCWKNDGCSIDDEMQNIYPFIDECDNIVIASPIWFSSLSGPTLNISSRIQTLFASYAFRNEPKRPLTKNGVIILVGGEPGTEMIPERTAKIILKFMGVYRPSIVTIKSMNTNKTPACEDEFAKNQCRYMAKQLNKRNQSK